MVFEDLKFRKDKHHHLIQGFGKEVAERSKLHDQIESKFNKINLILYTFTAAFLIAWAIISLFEGKICFPARPRRPVEFCYQGDSVSIHAIGLIFGGFFFVAKIGEHFSKRDMTRFKKVMKFTAIGLLLLAYILAVFFWKEAKHIKRYY